MLPKNLDSKVIPFSIFLIILIVFFKIIEPLITIFLSSIIITYLFYPAYNKIKSRIINKSISSMLTIMLIILIFLIPLSYLVFEVSHESINFYNSISTNIEEGSVFGLGCISESSEVCEIIQNIENFNAEGLSKIGFDVYLHNFFLEATEKAPQYLGMFFKALISMIFILYISYYLFKDGKQILKIIIDWIPLKNKTVDELINKFGNVTNSVVFAQLFVALVQGVVGVIGFLIFGIPIPLFWGVIMAFFALVPTIGTAIVWVPASIYLMLNGYVNLDNWILIKGIGLFLYGLFIISTIDNILRVKIIQIKSQVHPIIIIAGVIGGINLFGFFGMFIGPILLPMCITYFKTLTQKIV